MAVAAESLTVPGTSRESDPLKRSKRGAIPGREHVHVRERAFPEGSNEAAYRFSRAKEERMNSLLLLNEAVG